jgi:hypothetical protein
MLLALAASLSTLPAGQSSLDLPVFLYTAAPRYVTGEERFPAGAHLVLVSGNTRREFAAGFFASADAEVSYDGRRVLFSARPTREDVWQIWEADADGGNRHRIFASAEACIRPLYLPDGRVVYTRGSQIETITLATGKIDVLTPFPGKYLTDDVLHDGRILFEWDGELFTVYPDGTGVESVRCEHGPRRSSGRQVSTGDLIFGVDGGLARFTSALTTQQKLAPTGLEIAGPIAEIAPDRWLVAGRKGGEFAIYQTGPRSARVDRVEAVQGMNAVQPVIVRAKVPPREFPSALVPTRTTGNLLCLDAKEAKQPIDGKVHAVRVYSRDAAGASQVLGNATVAPDGSFYIEVPANRPIRMELVDEAGGSLRAEHNWFWMRSSEQRVCVGCHAGPERAPENRVPEILNQILSPVKMLGTQGHPQ